MSEVTKTSSVFEMRQASTLRVCQSTPLGIMLRITLSGKGSRQDTKSSAAWADT
jgi:hypothetical protein